MTMTANLLLPEYEYVVAYLIVALESASYGVSPVSGHHASLTIIMRSPIMPQDSGVPGLNSYI